MITIAESLPVTTPNPATQSNRGDNGATTGAPSKFGETFGAVVSEQKNPRSAQQTAENGKELLQGGNDLPVSIDPELVVAIDGQNSAIIDPSLSMAEPKPEEVLAEVLEAVETGVEQSGAKIPGINIALEMVGKETPVKFTEPPAAAVKALAADFTKNLNSAIAAQPDGEPAETLFSGSRTFEVFQSLAEGSSPSPKLDFAALAQQQTGLDIRDIKSSAPNFSNEGLANVLTPDRQIGTTSTTGFKVSSDATMVMDQQWNNEFAGRVKLLLANGKQEANIQLSPPELGRLEIRISTEGDQAKIHFNVQNAMAREAIEQAMPRLKEMLELDGLQLAQSDVFDKSQSQSSGDFDSRDDFLAATNGSDTEQLESDLEAGESPLTISNAKQMVDYYI